MNYIDLGEWTSYTPVFPEGDPRAKIDIAGLAFYRNAAGVDWNFFANSPEAPAGAAVVLDADGNVRFTAPVLAHLNPGFGRRVIVLPDVASAVGFASQRFDFITGEFEPLAAPVPIEVARHQALLALLDSGITRAMIEGAIAAIEDPVQRETTDIRYQQPNWRRDSEFIAWGKTVFGLSDQQVIDLFALAGTK